MEPKSKRKLTLADLIDFECQLADDEALDRQALRHRDRTIGLELDQENLGRRDLLLAWLDQMRERAAETPGRLASLALSFSAWTLSALGAMVGFGVANVVFAYDGSQPVNVVHVLGVFVVFQVFLLFLWWMAVAPRRWLRFGGGEDFQEILRLLSPARLAGGVARLLPRSYRDSLQRAQERFTAFDRLYGSVRLWSLFRISQCFALAFNIGALVGCLQLIVFSDLAFGWSTTLDVAPEPFHRLIRWLAAPWAWLAPGTIPSLDLITQSRFVRAGAGLSTEEMANLLALGGWWPYLVMAMATYGLVPRAVTWWVADWRLSRALDQVALDHASCDRLYERLIEPLVESKGEPETGAAAMPTQLKPETVESISRQPESTYLFVDWADTAPSAEAAAALIRERFGVDGGVLHRAGGLELENDERTLAAIAAQGAKADVTVTLFVQAWEPPTRDLSRFLADARERLGRKRPIWVVPVDLDEDGAFAEPESQDLAHWDRKMNALGDPWLRTITLGMEGGVRG